MKKVLVIVGIGITFVIFLLLWKANIDAINQPNVSQNPYIAKGYSEEMANRISELPKENQDYLLKEDYVEDLNDYFNSSEFKEENLKDYIELSKTYGLSLTDTMWIVNHQFYSNFYDEDTLVFMHSEYYIHDYLERYRNYKQININEDASFIISAVNCNLDFEFYTQDYEVDLRNPYLILVNKYYKLSSDYVPNNLVTIEAKYGRNLSLDHTVYEQYKKMWEVAKEQGLTLYIKSPYRSYQTQQNLYNKYVAKDGKKAADTYSARPGYSEHQTGLAFDVTSPTTNFDTFESSKEFLWLQEHAHEYGFILRYPKGKEYITGYIYEPWHYRYVGVEAATKIKETGLTYEEYYAYYVR